MPHTVNYFRFHTWRSWQYCGQRLIDNPVSFNPVKSAALGLLWLYKRILSPILYFFGVRCRHYPSCSDYSSEAFRMHRFWRAFWLSISRLVRCHPFGSHGFDPVPSAKPDVGWKFWQLGDWTWRERGLENPTPSNDPCPQLE
jgi:putative membrane protein insertion efficiency factor